MDAMHVSVGEFSVSKTPGDVMKTFALGSCVAVIFLIPELKAVGLVHVALPDSTLNLNRSKEKPGFFADTGIPALLKEIKN